MSHLKTALAITIALLAVSAGTARAANNHSPFSLFGLIGGLGGPLVMVEDDTRKSAIDLPGPGKKPSSDDGDWVFNASDGTWHYSTEERTDSLTSNTVVKPDTTWSTQEVSQPKPKWTPHPASP